MDIGEELQRGRTYATVARHLGVERDVDSVVAGVLRACVELFPHARAATLLVEQGGGHLQTLGPLLRDGTVRAAAEPSEVTVPRLRRETPAPRVWRRRREASLLAPAFDGAAPGSAAAAAIRFPDGTSGLLLLAAGQEDGWSEADLPVLEVLGEETGRAVTRARRHDADVEQALMDSVTGLVSHRQLVRVLDKEVARAGRAGASVAVIFTDLDEFKRINDEHGHDAGNRVLAMYADVLRATLRREDTAARYGGDEFVCILPGADREQAGAVAERIQQAFHEAGQAESAAAGCRPSVSCGIAVFPIDGDDAATTLNAADSALLRVKQERAAELTGRPRRRQRTRTARGAPPA